MQTLIINAHPDYANENTFSAKLQAMFVEQFHAKFPGEEPEVLDLYAAEIPRLEKPGLLSAWEKGAAGEPLTELEAAALEASAALLEQFKACHRVVIVTPLHNFNVGSRLKDYLDNVLIAGQTFKYVSGGSVGLMNDDRKAMLLQASGSVYTNNDRYTAMDFQPAFLYRMFADLMAFNAFETVRIQGTSTSAVDNADELARAKARIAQLFDKFYQPA